MKPTEQEINVKNAIRDSIKRQNDNLLAAAREEGIGLVHIHNGKGGITIAFKPATPYKNCYMVDVAVNTCSVEDTFVRKLGAIGAVEKFLGGETIQLPLLSMFSNEDLSYVVKRAFTALYKEATLS